MWRCLAAVACIGFLTSSCASYKGQPLPQAQFAPGLGTTLQQVTLRLQPLNAEQAKTVFDTNPEDIRILFVRILLQNEGEQSYAVGRYQMRLVTKQGVALAPISPSRVAKKMRARHDELAMGSVFLFGILSYPSFHSANEANDAMLKDLTDKTFPEHVELAPHASVGGILYFEIPLYVNAIKGLRMDVVLRPVPSGDPLEFRVPLATGAKEEMS